MQDVAEQSPSGGAGPRTVLVVCSTFRDHRELPGLARPGLLYLFHDYASTSLEELIGGRGDGLGGAADPIAEVARIRAEIGDRDIAGVVSTDDYPGAALAAVLAKELGLPGPEPRASLICQHKYLSRVAQGRIVPDAVPAFWPIDVAEHAVLPEGMTFPAFVKPMKSFFSIGAQRIESVAELEACKDKWAKLDEFFLPLDRLLRAPCRNRDRHHAAHRRRPARGRAGHGRRLCVWRRGSHSRRGRFDYSSAARSLFRASNTRPRCRERVQERMGDIARRLMSGLGFDNFMFNIEMMYDSRQDRIAIIEINPRMASQFADLYEKVDGTNAYDVLLDLGTGVRPTPKRRQGKYRFAASCVLRTFEDCIVAALPSAERLAEIERAHPDIRVEIHATAGRRLSDELQDGTSFRYGIVSLGGRNRADVLSRFEACQAELGIVLVPISGRESVARARFARHEMGGEEAVASRP